DIESSLRQWVEAETDMLRNLTTHFPAYSKIVSYAQLQGIIRNFNAVMNDSHLRFFDGILKNLMGVMPQE
ncbi:hypothetical protein O3P69_016274, partial [Scylla paramamosain]